MSKFILSTATAFHHGEKELALLRCPPEGVQLPGALESSIEAGTIVSCSAAKSQHEYFNLFIDATQYGTLNAGATGFDSALCDEVLYALGFDIDTQAVTCPIARPTCEHQCQNTAVLPVAAYDSYAIPDAKHSFHPHKDYHKKKSWKTGSDLKELSHGICGISGVQNLTAVGVTQILTTAPATKGDSTILYSTPPAIWLDYSIKINLNTVVGSTAGANFIKQLLFQELVAPEYLFDKTQCGFIASSQWFLNRNIYADNNYDYGKHYESSRELSETNHFWNVFHKDFKRHEYRLVCPDHMKGGVRFPHSTTDEANPQFLCMAWSVNKWFAIVNTFTYTECVVAAQFNGFDPADVIQCMVEIDDECEDKHECPEAVVLPKLVHECVFDGKKKCEATTTGKQIDVLPGLCTLDTELGVNPAFTESTLPAAVTYYGGFTLTTTTLIPDGQIKFGVDRVIGKDTCTLFRTDFATQLFAADNSTNNTQVLSSVWYTNTDCPEYEKYGTCWCDHDYDYQSIQI